MAWKQIKEWKPWFTFLEYGKPCNSCIAKTTTNINKNGRSTTLITLQSLPSLMYQITNLNKKRIYKLWRNCVLKEGLLWKYGMRGGQLKLLNYCIVANWLKTTLA
jgi:hypothetical protein